MKPVLQMTLTIGVVSVKDERVVLRIMTDRQSTDSPAMNALDSTEVNFQLDFPPWLRRTPDESPTAHSERIQLMLVPTGQADQT